MRNLERQIGSLCRKAAKEIVEDGVKKVTFKADNLENILAMRNISLMLYQIKMLLAL